MDDKQKAIELLKEALRILEGTQATETPAPELTPYQQDPYGR